MTAGNYVDRLAAIAANFARRDVLEQDCVATERVRAGLAARFSEELSDRGVDVDDVTLHSVEAPGPLLVPAVKRGRGRPPVRSTDFYRRVAEAAREAAADPKIRAIWRGVADRAAPWPECGGRPPAQSTVEGWLKEARRLKFYKGPRA
jgi:hypothetical protein